jgi:hypothetical protein
MRSAFRFSWAICAAVMPSPSARCPSASAIQSRRHVRNLRSGEKSAAISADA